MATYTVKQASLKKTWNGQYGPMRVLNLTVQQYGHEPIQCEWRTKGTAEDPLPQEGSTIELEVSQGQYGLEARKPQGAGGGGGGRTRPPEERRSIAMQHAQKCAVSLLEVAATHGSYKPPEKVADMAFHVEAVAASLFKQVMTAEAGQ